MSELKTSKYLLQHLNGLKRVRFDPKDVQHVKIARTFLTQGRQDPVIRFELEHPYLDVRSMILNRIADVYIADFLVDEVKPVVKRVRKSPLVEAA